MPKLFSKTMLTSSLYAFVLSVALTNVMAQEEDDVSILSRCIDPTPYAINPGNLATLQNGGDISNDIAVFFDFPHMDVPPGGLIFCLDNITIPDTVGGNPCDGYDECFLAVGFKTAEDDEENTPLSKYNCLCSGASFDPEGPFLENSVSASCGLAEPDEWGLACPDTSNGRFHFNEDGVKLVSNISSAYFSICPESQNRCDSCGINGNKHPSFVAGLQWISKLQEQCFYDPFATYEDYVPNKLSTGAIVGISVGSVLFVVAAIAGLLYYAGCRKQASSSSTIPAAANGRAPDRVADVELQSSSKEESQTTNASE